MSADSHPLVTIVTPAYNRARQIEETIESVLAQTYPNVEYLVIDDGSQDRTVEVLRRYESRLRWVSHANVGEPRTVNRGWQMARGEFIATVNSDDPVFPEFVARAVDFMRAHPDVLVGYPDWVMIDGAGVEMQRIQTHEYDQANLLRWHCCMPGPGAMMRRRVLDLAGFRNPEYRYAGDYEYWLRVSLHGPLARIPQVLARWRNHAGGATHTHVGMAMAAELPRMMHAFFRSPGLSPEIQELEAETLGVAYFLAGAQCLACDATSMARRYFLRSIYHYPLSTSYPTGLNRSIRCMLSHVLLPARFRRWLREALACGQAPTAALSLHPATAKGITP